MALKEISVTKYVVRLSPDERNPLEDFVGKGKHVAPLVTRARILLKAGVSDLGEGWSNSRIGEASDTNRATVQRTRERFVEEGFEAVLSREYNPKSARPRTFDGAAEAKLAALTRGPAPGGFAKIEPALAGGEGRRIEHRRQGER